MLGRNFFDALPETRGSVFEEQFTSGVKEKRELTFETYFGIKPYENWYDVRVYPYRDGISVYFQVTTAHKKTQEALVVSHRFLQIAYRHTEMRSLLREFVDEIQKYTGCEAIGIRVLGEGGIIPYEAYVGFSDKFYHSESALSIMTDMCMCINVVKGATNSVLPFYTKGGSFYMNGTTRFLATVSEEEKGQTRNVCNQAGYESVALVPIRAGERIFGLVHIADPKENMVPLYTVEAIEGAATQLGTAIERVWMQEDLRKSEKRYRELSLSLEGTVKKQVAELRQAQTLADIGRMVSVVAHEIRNPLHSINLGIDSLQGAVGERRKSRQFQELSKKSHTAPNG